MVLQGGKMKVLKFVFIITLFLLLASCDLFQKSTTTDSTITTEEGVSFSDYASINKELETVFEVDDEVPDFSEYLILTSDLEFDIEIVTELEGELYFEEIGNYTVEFILSFEDEYSVSYVLEITVNEKTGTPYNYRSNLYQLLNNTNNAEYLRYSTINDVSYNGTDHLQSNSDYEYYFHQYTGENLFHVYQEYDINGEIDYLESYFYFDMYNINFYNYSFETNYEWVNEVISIEEYLEEVSLYGDKTMANLLDGITVVHSIEDDSASKTFQIPLSNDNFSISMVSDIIDTVYLFGLYDTESDELFNILSENYDLITVKIKTNLGLSKILEIEYDYTLLLNYLLQDDDSGLHLLSTSELNYSFDYAIYKEMNYNTEHFVLTIPDEVLYKDVKQPTTTLVDADDIIVDSLVDEENNQIFYTVSDSKYLYAYNYDTHELHHVPFELYPEHIYLRNGKVYVSLYGGEHKYYWPIDEQYGAFAVVDAENIEVDNVFNIGFDPGDIVVDIDNIVYIIHGSNHYCAIESFNPISGMKIDSVGGVDYRGTLLYSDYTNRIYEVEYNASNFEVFSLDRGILSEAFRGNDGFNRSSLKVSSYGTDIYSGNGVVFNLSNQADFDTFVTEELGFEFYHIAFNETDGLRYFSMDEIIVTVDSNDEVEYAMYYSGISDALHYGDGLLFNIFDRYIEVLNPVIDSETVKEKLVTHISKDETFNPIQYIHTVTGGLYELSLISNYLDTSTVGTYEVKYDVTKIGNVEVDRELTLFVNVIDDIGPEITINDEPTSINVGDSYSPAGCTAIDNVDGEVSCELFESKVNPSKIGDYEVVYKATDSKGNTSYKTTFITVELANLEYNVSPININADVTDVELDIDRNAFYYIDYENKKLVKFSLLDNSTTEIVFDKQPEHMLKDGNKLYVTILMGGHASNWRSEDQIGKIVIVDLDTFTLTDTFDINIDPYSINIYNDLLYIGPGSGQSGNIHVYNKDTMEFLGTSCRVDDKLDLKIDQNTGYLYGPSRGYHPPDILKYMVNGVECLGIKYEDYHGEYKIDNQLFISPYQDHLFSTNGIYYAYASSETNSEMGYDGDLGFEFRGMYFNTTTDLVYYGLANGYIYIATVENGYNPHAEINTGYPVSEIIEIDGTIYIFSIDRTFNRLVFVEVTEK